MQFDTIPSWVGADAGPGAQVAEALAVVPVELELDMLGLDVLEVLNVRDGETAVC